jgi:hypothetical protein
VKRTQAQLNDIHSQIQLEINRILSSLRAEASAANQRQGSLLAAAASPRAAWPPTARPRSGCWPCSSGRLRQAGL